MNSPSLDQDMTITTSTSHPAPDSAIRQQEGTTARRLPSPPASVLGRKRSIPGKAAHEFVGAKSRRLDEQQYAPHLLLAENATQEVGTPRTAGKDRKKVGGPRKPKQSARKLPPVPPSGPPNVAPTPQPIGHEPSFQVAPQPAQAHKNADRAQALSREPSFTVQPQSTDPALPERLQLAQERLEQQRSDNERLAWERFNQQRLEQQQLRSQPPQQRQPPRIEQERVEPHHVAQLDHAQEVRQGEQQEQEQVERELMEPEHVEPTQEQLDRLRRQWAEQQQVVRERVQREGVERERMRLERARVAREREQAELELERVDQQRLDWFEERRIKQEQEVRAYQLLLQEQLRQPVDESMAIDPEEVDIAINKERSRKPPVESPSSTSGHNAPLPPPSTSSQLVDPLPFQNADNDPPPGYQSPAKPTPAAKTSSDGHRYRVPSPAFMPAPPSALTEAPSAATAQLVALLLEQNERTNRAMQLMLEENHQLRSALTAGFADMRQYIIAAIQEARLQPANEDGEGPQVADDEDAGQAGDDELEIRPKQRRKRKVSVLKDPKLKSEVTYLQGCVRDHLFFLFDVKSIEELIAKNPPITDEEMKSYLEGEDLITCSLQHFRIDFQRHWKDTDFNKLAKNVFVKSFLAMQKAGQYDDDIITLPPCLLTEKVVGEVLDHHMDYRRKQYRDHLVPLTKAEKAKILKRKAMNARRHTLRESRVSVVVEFGLDEHKKLFAKLRPIHMSGDETDGPVKTHPPIFRIVEARWQSLALKTFLRMLDALYRETWAKPVGDRATSGNPPRNRVEHSDARTEDGVAPIGLWRNCYDDAWLRSLRPHVRESLNIINSDYDFRLPMLRTA